MANGWVALGVAAAALLMASSALDPADARHGGGHGGGGARGGGGGPSMSMRSYSSNASHTYRSGTYTLRSYGTGKTYAGKVYGSHRGHRHAHRLHRRHVVGIYDSYYGYYSDCEWLRQRALYTGSSYWWSRYNACLDSYGYY